MTTPTNSEALPPTTCSPRPESNGKCSRDCPKFYYDRMPGWPSAQACYVWDETLDGEEPYYLTGAICRPAIRLANTPDQERR